MAVRKNPVVRQCPICKQAFASWAPNQIICSKACRRDFDRARKRMGPIMVSCRQCNKQFVTQGNKSRFYCSNLCKGRFHAGKEHSKNGPPIERVIDNEINYLFQDAAFCERMIDSGYEMVGLNKTPCTEHPIYMDLGIHGGHRGGWAMWPWPQGSD